jgi:hypothetical protein
VGDEPKKLMEVRKRDRPKGRRMIYYTNIST